MKQTLQKCENCGQEIGKLETPHLHNGHVVRAKCDSKLSRIDDGQFVTAPASLIYARGEEYRALGLASRGWAWTVAIIGLCLSPAVIGIPLLIWGMVADSMLVKHRKEIERYAAYRSGR